MLLYLNFIILAYTAYLPYLQPHLQRERDVVILQNVYLPKVKPKTSKAMKRQRKLNLLENQMRNLTLPDFRPKSQAKTKYKKELITIDDFYEAIENNQNRRWINILTQRIRNRTLFPDAKKEFSIKGNQGIIDQLIKSSTDKKSQPFETPWDTNRKIPFYYYEDSELYPNLLDYCPQFVSQNEVKYDQQGDDVQFNLQARNHPWRTYDPEEAEIFVAPTFLNFVLKTKFREWSWYTDSKRASQMDLNFMSNGNTLCDTKTNATIEGLTNRVCKNVMKSKWFLRSDGLDHVCVNSEWRIQYSGFYHPCGTLLKKIYVGNYEVQSNVKYSEASGVTSYFQGRKFRCTVVVPYVDKSLIYDHKL